MTMPRLTLRHFALALSVVFIWGTNFVVIKDVLASMPPLWFATLRFALAFLPAALWLTRPRVPLGYLVAYGILIGVGQFGVMYLAMTAYISPGLASLVVQNQVFFTIGLAMLVSNEKIRGFQAVALLLAMAGLWVIGLHTDGTTTPLGLGMMLIAALSWACANIITRRVSQLDPQLNTLAFVVWASVFSVPILAGASWYFEGSAAIVASLQQATWGTWLRIVWQSAANTLFGYAAWAWLLARYPAATISPLSLLVPVFGMSASAIYLNESLPAWKLTAATLILAGLALNTAWPLLNAAWARNRR
ncbi:MAG: EamA family transporter [Formosimonas sp.]